MGQQKAARLSSASTAYLGTNSVPHPFAFFLANGWETTEAKKNEFKRSKQQWVILKGTGFTGC
jgi:hypothetical protein